MDEGIYTIGRRFPSIRVKSKEKKKEKKKSFYQKSKDKKLNVETSKGSCARPVEAIYGTLSEDHQLESNIYENGHIVMKHETESLKCQKICCGKKPSQCLMIVIIVSVIIFILTGSFLLLSSGKILRLFFL